MKVQRIIHQVWFGGAMPKKYRKYRKTWKKHHPNWEFRLYTEKNLPDYIDREVLKLCNNYSEVSDAIRWPVVYNSGGIYLDTDFTCYKNIEPLLKGCEVFISTEDNHHLSGGFFGATKHHPLIKRMVDLIEPTLRATMDKPSDYRIGPRWVTEHISKDEISVLPKKYFYPYLPGDQRGHDMIRKRGEAYAAHIWGGSWLRNPKQKIILKALTVGLLVIPFLRYIDFLEVL